MDAHRRWIIYLGHFGMDEGKIGRFGGLKFSSKP